tara:strand:- start:9157 stop:10251 length:1095 start_codon:yes stop_codon:yes gene_type:complete
MKNYKKKIIIATGGTGGHIFPSLSLADFLKKKYFVEIITDKRGLQYLNNYNNVNIRIINSGTIFQKNIFQIFFGIIKVIRSFILSLVFMIIYRPKLIIGMGGYSSFPVCLAGFFLRIPTLIYENNIIIGRANKYLLPFVNKIFVSSNSIKGIKNKYNKKIFFSGFLIRNTILNLQKDKKEKSKNNLSILIMGGSQSAKIFGDILPDVIIKCFQRGYKFKIYQQCTDKQVNEIRKKYQKFNIEFELFSFSGDMSKYYRQADLAITRSGASSLAELINLRIPFIALPLPSSVDNHQFMNAKYFQMKGYCFLLEEKFVSDKLMDILIDLHKNEKKLFLISEKMSEHSDKNVFSKVEKLIKEILNEQN